MRSQGGGPRIRELANQDTPGDGDGTQSNRHAPLLSGERTDSKGGTAHEDDEDLATDHDQIDNDVKPVASNAFKNVEVVIKTATVELVEDLEPDKRVEHEGLHVLLLIEVGHIVAHQRGTGKMQDERNGELADGLTDDHLTHASVDQRGRLLVGSAVEN